MKGIKAALVFKDLLFKDALGHWIGKTAENQFTIEQKRLNLFSPNYSNRIELWSTLIRPQI